MRGASINQRLHSPVRQVISRGKAQLFQRRMQWILWRLAGRRLMNAFANAYEGFFIEVGANDGRQADPLRRLARSERWRGIMVEPQPDAFRRLRENYGANERLILENLAIADRDGRIPFYELAPPAEGQSSEVFGSYDLLGSVSMDVLLKHDWVSDAANRIVRTEVDCLRLESLCRRHSVERLDILKCDIEGYDDEVVRQLGASRFRPRVVAYEHALLPARRRDECRERMRGLGYELMEELFDTWCFDARIEDGLTRRWRRLRPIASPVVFRDD